MTAPLRVFISSTMKDLANERDAVCRKLREFNFEPVNAEGWLPDGSNSWERIASELNESNLFVLITGESYGWIPTAGPQAGTGLSVTEIEYNEACDLEILVLPFLKNLPYGTDSASPDAKKRDEFRERVRKWENGYFAGTFNLASDLANSVAKALIDVLSSDFLKNRIRERMRNKTVVSGIHWFGEYVPPPVPSSLIRDVLSGEAVLFAGAGMSLAAGMPSAAAFAQYLAEAIHDHDPRYVAASTFAGVAADFEAITSRDVLVGKVRSLLDTPQGLVETVAHVSAVRLFNLIFTTNWDDLFERSLSTTADTRAVITDELATGLPERALVKLHGTLEYPRSLLITEGDIASMDVVRHELWSTTRQVLRDRPVVVVGTQLRDPSIVKLFHESRPLKGGYLVSPSIDLVADARLRAFNLTGVPVTAEKLFETLELNAGDRAG